MQKRERKKLQKRLATRMRNRLNGEDDKGMYAAMECMFAYDVEDMLRYGQRYATLFHYASIMYHAGIRNSPRHTRQLNLAKVKIDHFAVNAHAKMEKLKNSG